MVIPESSYWNQFVPAREFAALETAGLGIAIVGAFLARGPIDRLLRKAEDIVKSIGRRPRLSIVIIFLLAIMVRLALLPLVPEPGPKSPLAPDDYSYLLGAETYASGRLTNPAHPLWQHFESYHIIVRPTYQSMYLPAQAAFIALGQVVGHPWYGVVLCAALMGAAICWMLQGWISNELAFLGGLLITFRVCAASRWIDTFWGGAVAGLGGALVLGAVPRLARAPRMRESLLMAAGIVLLANARPYEGAVFTALCGIVLLRWMLRSRTDWRQVTRVVVAPVAIVLLVAGAALIYYCWRVTGNALTLPYALNMREYHVSRPFLWQPLPPMPVFRHEVLRRAMMDWEGVWWPDTRTVSGLWFFTARKLEIYYMFFVFGCAVPFVVGFLHLRKLPRLRVLFPVLLLFVLALLVETWIAFPHYAAPATGLLVLVTVVGFVRMRAWAPQGFWGRLARSLVVVSVLLVAYVQVRTSMYTYYRFPEHWSPARYRVAAQLARIPGKHLVIVRYSREHRYWEDWVYNAPDIDNARVVWAREMDPAANDRLLAYFHDRHVWLVNADEAIIRPEPYQELPSDALLRECVMQAQSPCGKNGMEMASRSVTPAATAVKNR